MAAVRPARQALPMPFRGGKAALSVVLPLVLVLAGANVASAGLTAREHAFVAAVNTTRAAHGVPPLSVDATLTRAARYQSRISLARDVLAHGDFADRLRRFGATGRMLGENLAWASAGAAQARAIVGMWLKSPPHRENLLRPSFRRIGVGTAVGEFRGYGGSTVVTADFAG
jgi:uncharacterized protein YkwD